MTTSTLTAKGQTTVPREIREHLGLKPGDKIDYTIQPDGSVRLRTRKVRLADLAGILGRPPKAASIDDMDDAIAEAVAERMRRT
ncbi:MAG: type II toxin-antitoxin system PrlF family antitoxin [Rhodovibrio sp.]|nr:type II toxin-antitoxin system PrlF family antitoxin [Rhodovibrio sp.]